MKFLWLLFTLTVITQCVDGKNCLSCFNDYTTDKSTAKDIKKQCAAVQKLAQCLITETGTGCAKTEWTSTSVQFSTGNLTTDLKALGPENCKLDALCTQCQANYQKAIQTRNSNTKDSQKCVEDFTYLSCVEERPSGESSCDGESSQPKMTIEAMKTAKADCAYAGSSGMRSSLIVLGTTLLASFSTF